MTLMMKIALLALGLSTLPAAAAFVFAGRTVHSSPFQMAIPYGTAVKTTIDPANIWSWHHDFASGNQTVEVLVDVDGNNVMDTEHSWLRVVVTDIEVVDRNLTQAIVWVRDSTGRRFAVGGGWHQAAGHVNHVGLSTPIVLPVGSSLSVEIEGGGGSTINVNLIGRVVSL